jgi:sec-independent protein translocase protein TatC
MYLLKKVIQLRENSHPDHEKPFLEHLEDLRIMITRIVITLLVSVIICFTFQKQLMEILRQPVEQVWIAQLEKKLPQKEGEAPKPLDVDTWEQAKALEHAAAGLDAAQREAFYQTLDPDIAFHARSVALLRAVLALPEDQREAFLTGLEAPEEMKQQVTALLQNAPNPEVDGRGNLRLMSALKPTETFMLSMKLSFFAGIVLAFPLLLLFVLQFVLPGLHHNEKRVLWPSMLVGFGLFLGGVLFAYSIVLPRALEFFYEWSGNLGVSNDWRIGEYISFATQFTLLFGLAFELPVVVMVLVKLGLLSYETMSGSRAYAALAIFVTAAVLTPTPDAFTLTLMAVPMLILYEICIWLAWFDRRKNRKTEEQEAREREEQRLASGEATDDTPADDPYSSYADESADPHLGEPGDDYHADHPDESGDDGYDGELPQQDFHEYPALPDDTGIDPEEPSQPADTEAPRAGLPEESAVDPEKPGSPEEK